MCRRMIEMKWNLSSEKRQKRGCTSKGCTLSPLTSCTLLGCTSWCCTPWVVCPAADGPGLLLFLPAACGCTPGLRLSIPPPKRLTLSSRLHFLVLHPLGVVCPAGGPVASRTLCVGLYTLMMGGLRLSSGKAISTIKTNDIKDEYITMHLFHGKYMAVEDCEIYIVAKQLSAPRVFGSFVSGD
ncbi:hypothetical protein RJT34_09357 [Clitoria ternatea]|uniref:Uncharacterized protein n=1 Tax=Clitoria ternatea TaxID=43366 RepID=A0AAN9K7P3_CLITE